MHPAEAAALEDTVRAVGEGAIAEEQQLDGAAQLALPVLVNHIDTLFRAA
jgi:hypothetical protein